MDLESLRKICLKLPAVTEDVKWEHDLVFSVGAKMFCATSLEPPFSCSFKVADESFESLITQPGFEPAPYMARAKWVLVTEKAKISKKEWEDYVRESYEMVKAKLTKKLRQELGI
jgi:predicted DNA-binding protein (MmcQ/YjbR family)